MRARDVTRLIRSRGQDNKTRNEGIIFFSQKRIKVLHLSATFQIAVVVVAAEERIIRSIHF